jgi:DNA modification methylase
MIKLYKGDCLEVMKKIPAGSVDMILCDLPYGTTKCKWDSVIPLNDFIIVKVGKKNKTLNYNEWLIHSFKKEVDLKFANRLWYCQHRQGLWSHYNRIIKNNGAVVLTAQTPFDKVLGFSNLKMLKYEWIWEKTQATGHLNAKKMPMKAHENILVFYKKLPTYNPQKTTGHKPINSYTKYVETQNNTEIYGKMKQEISGGGETDRYPRSVITYASDKQKLKLHSTQKPVELMEYLIKTYTNENDLVLDNTMGSGTTGVACVNTNRNFIGIEMNDTYFETAKNRINETT